MPPDHLPISVYLSQQAQEAMLAAERAPAPARTPYTDETITQIRRDTDNFTRGLLALVREDYAVKLRRASCNGVPVHVVTPAGGTTSGRVILELHAGAFLFGTTYGLVEAAPIAALTGHTVVCVDYRLAPKHQHPAALEDASCVYRALLDRFNAAHIGVVGSSAGGLLASQLIARNARDAVPQPGAIAMLAAGADVRFDGDTRYRYPPAPPAPHGQGGVLDYMLERYFPDADLRARLISPAWDDDVLTSFPPSLLITATRAFEMSSVVFTHQRLLKAGVAAELHIWDGLSHCFYLMSPRLPESKAVFERVASFFRGHLGA